MNTAASRNSRKTGRQRAWVVGKPKCVPQPVRDMVDAWGQKLVEKHLKPTHVQPPPEKPQWNYIVVLTPAWRPFVPHMCPRPGKREL